MGDFIDMTGRKYGRYTVLEKIRKHNKWYWVCKCECGNIKEVNGSFLRNGMIQSCGCLHRDMMKTKTKHGMINTKLYYTWMNMIERCRNPRNKAYKNYGGRGIVVCEEWKSDFMVFYKWAISNGYDEKLTLDRIDVNGNYEPSNCRWITNKEQQNNRRNNHYVTFNGETHTITEWGEITGLGAKNIHNRIVNYHWNIEKALTIPIGKRRKGKILQIDKKTKDVIAEYKSFAEAARVVGVKKPSNICSCCQGRYGHKSIKGYEWKFIEDMDYETDS